MAHAPRSHEETTPSAALDQLLYEQAPRAWALHDILRQAFAGSAGKRRPFPADLLSVIHGAQETMPGAKRATLELQDATGRWTAALHTARLGRATETNAPEC